VGQCPEAIDSVAGREALMGNKDKGGRTSKKEAAKGLKEKRLDKKIKRAAHKAAGNPSVDRTFDR
jgi:hypothetical protein